MRYFEFAKPLTEDVEQTGALLSVLNYLLKNAESKDADGKFKMSSLLTKVRNAGAKTFDYTNFVDAFQKNVAVQNLVSNYNKEYITLNLDSSENSTVGEVGSAEDQADTVNQMAKKAVSL
jgi:DNA polymerase sigma